MSDPEHTCPSCGARVPPDHDRCELCGTPVEGAEDIDSAESSGRDAEGAEPEAGAAGASARGDGNGSSVYCNDCGWENPPGARYCSQCGSKLQSISGADEGTRPVDADLPSGREEAEKTEVDRLNDEEESGGEDHEDQPEVAMGRQIALVVGGALVVVLVFFGATQWSAQYEWGSDSEETAPASQAGPNAGGASGQRPMASGGQGGARGELTDLQTLLSQSNDSLGGSIGKQVDSLRAQAQRASGTEKRQVQAELVNLLIGAGHPGRAAIVQQEIADATGTVEARRREADLLYRWMQKFEQQGQRQQVFEVARHAAKAYEAVVQERPNDLDARTRMGESYLLTNNPMRGIKAINGVLDDDSTFVPARFQKGLALLQINRLDQAVRQFEKVKQFADEGSPFYRQADRALTVIEQQRNASSSGTGSPGATGSP